jgi:hypothetical protein
LKVMINTILLLFIVWELPISFRVFDLPLRISQEFS